jgi:hypothetical protein
MIIGKAIDQSDLLPMLGRMMFFVSPKRLLQFALPFLLCGTLFIQAMPVANAHELLPKALLEFTEQNPEATPEEIDAFIRSNPELASKGDEARLRLVSAAQNQETTFADLALDFIRLGIDHILAGLDHILFVLALLLTFVSLRKTLKLITAFTVAHSITLILAGLGIVVLRPEIVEPLIALSIAYVALTSVFLKNHPFFGKGSNKTLSVFLFGLFHGLGFAGLLTELGIPKDRFISCLLFFNVGIEIGQLLILVIAVPILLLLRRSRVHDIVIKVIAVLISLLAIFWTVERIWGAFA